MDLVPTLLARVAAARHERRRAEEDMAQRFAPRFNPLSLLFPGENQLSNIIRWMLDEKETHGQGALFRDRFVSLLLQSDPAGWTGARASTEVSTADGLGRMDILLESADGNRCIVIENKPWAQWQTDQLSRYLNDQQVRRTDVQLHALIGHGDANSSLHAHWTSSTGTSVPTSVTASSFAEVAEWLEDCASQCRADRVRAFLVDLSGYCRSAILNEAGNEQMDTTADLILAAGSDGLDAARQIAASLPLAQSRAAAEQVGGTVEMVGTNPTIQLRIEDAVVNFALFGVGAPWAGVVDARRLDALRGDCSWGKPERLWPRWTYVKNLGDPGRRLDEAVRGGDIARAADLMILAASRMIGTERQHTALAEISSIPDDLALTTGEPMSELVHLTEDQLVAIANLWREVVAPQFSADDNKGSETANLEEIYVSQPGIGRQLGELLSPEQAAEAEALFYVGRHRHHDENFADAYEDALSRCENGGRLFEDVFGRMNFVECVASGLDALGETHLAQVFRSNAAAST